MFFNDRSVFVFEVIFSVYCRIKIEKRCYTAINWCYLVFSLPKPPFMIIDTPWWPLVSIEKTTVHMKNYRLPPERKTIFIICRLYYFFLIAVLLIWLQYLWPQRKLHLSLSLSLSLSLYVHWNHANINIIPKTFRNLQYPNTNSNKKHERK